jgi:hypothetical protein
MSAIEATSDFILCLSYATSKEITKQRKKVYIKCEILVRRMYRIWNERCDVLNEAEEKRDLFIRDHPGEWVLLPQEEIDEIKLLTSNVREAKIKYDKTCVEFEQLREDKNNAYGIWQAELSYCLIYAYALQRLNVRCTYGLFDSSVCGNYLQSVDQ